MEQMINGKSLAEIRTALAAVLEKGLVKGVGNPTPGAFCAEAAVCYVLGEPHGDRPSCVHDVDRALVIKLNDSYPGTEQERAEALRSILLAHLGTKGLDRTAWLQRIITETIRVLVPLALNAAANVHPQEVHQFALRTAAKLCEQTPTRESALAAKKTAYSAAAAYAAYSAAYSAAYAADAYAAAYAAYSAAAYAAAADAAAYAAYSGAVGHAARKEVVDKFIAIVVASYEAEGK